MERPRLNSPSWYERLWALHLRLLPMAQAYRAFAATPEGKVILADLAVFCAANAPANTERQQGRREVWLRIMHFTKMDPDELSAYYAGLSPEQRYQLWSPPGTQTYFQEDR